MFVEFSFQNTYVMPNFHFFGLILSFLKSFAHQSTLHLIRSLLCSFICWPISCLTLKSIIIIIIHYHYYFICCPISCLTWIPIKYLFFCDVWKWELKQTDRQTIQKNLTYLIKDNSKEQFSLDQSAEPALAADQLLGTVAVDWPNMNSKSLRRRWQSTQIPTWWGKGKTK